MWARVRTTGAALAALILTGCGAHDGAEVPASPDAAAQGIDSTPAAYRDPVTARKHWLTARLRRVATLRFRPGGRALARVGVRTEFGTPRVFGVLRARGSWLQVKAPELRNGQTGWIPADAAKPGATDVSVDVDRSRRMLRLRDGARVVLELRVAVGRPGTSTPLGRYAVTDRLHMGAGSPYGCCAIALTGHQVSLPRGWPGGDRLAIHGTHQPATIGHAASNGCVRAPTAGLRVLMRRVPLGAPVFVHQ
jgi:lipoprotein-anchoring transpeptidase ErfK/SrfK